MKLRVKADAGKGFFVRRANRLYQPGETLDGDWGGVPAGQERLEEVPAAPAKPKPSPPPPPPEPEEAASPPPAPVAAAPPPEPEPKSKQSPAPPAYRPAKKPGSSSLR